MELVMSLSWILFCLCHRYCSVYVMEYVKLMSCKLLHVSILVILSLCHVSVLDTVMSLSLILLCLCPGYCHVSVMDTVTSLSLILSCCKTDFAHTTVLCYVPTVWILLCIPVYCCFLYWISPDPPPPPSR